MKLNKLLDKIVCYTTLDIIDENGCKLFPIDKLGELEKYINKEDLKNYKVKEIIAFKSEPGIITIYIEKVNK